MVSNLKGRKNISIVKIRIIGLWLKLNLPNWIILSAEYLTQDIFSIAVKIYLPL